MNKHEIIKETEKAYLLRYKDNLTKGFWFPKSCIEIKKITKKGYLKGVFYRPFYNNRFNHPITLYLPEAVDVGDVFEDLGCPVCEDIEPRSEPASIKYVEGFIDEDIKRLNDALPF